MGGEKTVSRRAFVGASAAAAVSAGVGPLILRGPAAATQANDRVRLGMIGTGSRGCSLLRDLMKLKENFAVTHLADIYQPALDAGMKIVGGDVKGHLDYREMLEQKDLDAVLIAVPLYLHAEVSIAALDADKHVFCEKTLAHTIEQCKDIVRAAKRKPQLTFQVGQQRRYSGIYRQVMQLIANGAIGQVTMVRAWWHRNNDWRRPIPEPKTEAMERQINWRMYWEYSQGLMAELGSHQIDIANWVLGATPTRVTGFGGVDFYKDGREVFDNVAAVYDYPSGVKCVYTSMLRNEHYGFGEQILGSDGLFEVSLDGARYWREKHLMTAAASEAFSPQTTGAKQTQVLVTGATVKAEFSSSEPPQATLPVMDNEIAVQFTEFLRDLREHRKPACGVEEGRDVCVAILMANQAMRENKIVEWRQDFAMG